MIHKSINIIKVSAAALLAVINFSCSTSLKTIYPTLNDGKYDSEFPYKSSSKQLEAISNTIQRINCIAFYKAFILNEKSKITLSTLNDNSIKNSLKQNIFFENTSSGTATAISNENGYVALLTSAHIISFPDTIITYFSDENGQPTNYVESISLKENQRNYIAGFPNKSIVEILLIDKKIDVAVVGNRFDRSFATLLPVFDYPNGSAEELEWGTFVYVFGYPLSYKMISRAIVSNPDYDDRGSFLIDAVVNRGFSGGIVLAVRDGVPNFELVGMVQWMPEETNYVLTPKNSVSGYSPIIPYSDEEYVAQQKSYIYGITKVIPIDLIKKFINDNKDILSKKHYYLKSFFR